MSKIAREELARRLSQRTRKPYRQEQSCLPKAQAPEEHLASQPAAPIEVGDKISIAPSKDIWIVFAVSPYEVLCYSKDWGRVVQGRIILNASQE